MTAGLQALLAGVIDYAGLFPPARLTLEDSVRQFGAHRRTAEAWMLRHFVIPASQLPDLESLAGQADATPWTLSVLTSRCDKSDKWLELLADDLQTVADFQKHSSALASVSVLEVALPIDIATADHDAIVKLVDDAVRPCASADIPLSVVFLEVPTGPAAATVRETVADYAAGTSFDELSVGLKLRTGGLKAGDFPSLAELATVVRLCQQHRIAWKATAGLHSALPRRADDIGVSMHGFLNLLVAVALELAHKLDQQQLEQILSDSDASHFTFTDEDLRWRGVGATLWEVEAARQRFVSFGSCSFDEPVAELAELGYDGALARRSGT